MSGPKWDGFWDKVDSGVEKVVNVLDKITDAVQKEIDKGDDE